MISCDPEIMAGAPVFRGTRVPVHLIAELLERGTPIEELLEGYPSLTQEMVEYAPTWAATHPERGSPPVQPWSGYKPVRSIRGKLNAGGESQD
jgi:uncharacterized protein (DUF433 family)